ncbi:unnamed protein product [Protopolystoma xenopodis]|uniref:Uncharacterized protein n=1 Tax=Protopolystoma xenopodis TaxID=117903 RepID=A0A3S5A1B6_9PLAT|nr:unnamed protein product [Protopolystoma xenopodis]
MTPFSPPTFSGLVCPDAYQSYTSSPGQPRSTPERHLLPVPSSSDGRQLLPSGLPTLGYAGLPIPPDALKEASNIEQSTYSHTPTITVLQPSSSVEQDNYASAIHQMRDQPLPVPYSAEEASSALTTFTALQYAYSLQACLPQPWTHARPDVGPEEHVPKNKQWQTEKPDEARQKLATSRQRRRRDETEATKLEAGPAMKWNRMRNDPTAGGQETVARVNNKKTHPLFSGTAESGLSGSHLSTSDVERAQQFAASQTQIGK